MREFLRLESAGGILLVAAAVVAMLLANSPLRGIYESILGLPLQIRVGALDIDKPLLLWINDALNCGGIPSPCRVGRSLPPRISPLRSGY